MQVSHPLERFAVAAALAWCVVGLIVVFAK